MTNPTANDLALARFFRTLSTSALELARELESTVQVAGTPHIHLPDAALGKLQLAIATILATADPVHGISPREVTKAMDRNDEPNIRTTLYRLGHLGIAERLPHLSTQRWRLTELYRSGNLETKNVR